MKKVIKTTCVIRLTETTRDLFKKMNFPEVPEGAEYLACLENGDSCFLDHLELGTSKIWSPLVSKNVSINYYDQPIQIDIIEE